MPELIGLQGKAERINIAQDIGIHWYMVGTALLDDKKGTVMPALAQQYANDAERINTEVLCRWINGRGIADVTWRGLLAVLKAHCAALAESVEKILTATEAKRARVEEGILYIILLT